MVQPSALQHGCNPARLALQSRVGSHTIIGSAALVTRTTVAAAALLFSSAFAGPQANADTAPNPGAISAPAIDGAQQPRLVAERWYEATAPHPDVEPLLSAPPARDGWYLDSQVGLGAPAFSQQARDNWYVVQ